LDGLMALSNPTAMAATIGAAANHSQRDIFTETAKSYSVDQ
jgi:hypothetical protein